MALENARRDQGDESHGSMEAESGLEAEASLFPGANQERAVGGFRQWACGRGRKGQQGRAARASLKGGFQYLVGFAGKRNRQHYGPGPNQGGGIGEKIRGPAYDHRPAEQALEGMKSRQRGGKRRAAAHDVKRPVSPTRAAHQGLELGPALLQRLPQSARRLTNLTANIQGPYPSPCSLEATQFYLRIEKGGRGFRPSNADSAGAAGKGLHNRIHLYKVVESNQGQGANHERQTR